MMKPSGPAEHEALLLCARRQLDDEQSSRLRILARQKLDWEYLYKLARRHSLVPLFYYQIERAGGKDIPSPVLQRLRKDYQENSARNLIRTDELVSIIRELEANRIGAIPYNGPALAIAALGDTRLEAVITGGRVHLSGDKCGHNPCGRLTPGSCGSVLNDSLRIGSRVQAEHLAVHADPFTQSVGMARRTRKSGGARLRVA